jgi:hypothetical protein
MISVFTISASALNGDPPNDGGLKYAAAINTMAANGTDDYSQYFVYSSTPWYLFNYQVTSSIEFQCFAPYYIDSHGHVCGGINDTGSDNFEIYHFVVDDARWEKDFDYSTGSPMQIGLNNNNNGGKVEIDWSNYTITNGNGDKVYDPAPAWSTNVPITENGKSWYVDITSPRDGFKQSQLNGITTDFTFRIPYDDSNSTKFNIDVTGYSPNTETTDNEKTQFYDEGNGIAVGQYSVIGRVPFDAPSALTVTVTDTNGAKYTSTVTVECFTGFVDSNNDGLDDRAGDTKTDISNGDPNAPINVNTPIPSNSTAFNIFDPTTWFSVITGWFNTLYQSTGIQSFIASVASWFSYLPNSLVSLLGLGIAVAIILRIVGR